MATEVHYEFYYRVEEGLMGLMIGPAILHSVSPVAPASTPVRMAIGTHPMSCLLPPTGNKDSEEVFRYKEFFYQSSNHVQLATIVTTPRYLIQQELCNLCKALPLGILRKKKQQVPASVLVPSMQRPLASAPVSAATVPPPQTSVPATVSSAPPVSAMVSTAPPPPPPVFVVGLRKAAPLPPASFSAPRSVQPSLSVTSFSAPRSVPSSMQPVPVSVQVAAPPVSVWVPPQLPSSFFIPNTMAGKVWMPAPPMPVYIAPQNPIRTRIEYASISNAITYEEGLRSSSRPRPRLPPLFRHFGPSLTVPTVMHRRPIMQSFDRSELMHLSPDSLRIGMCPADGRRALLGFNPGVGNAGPSHQIVGNAGSNRVIGNVGNNPGTGNARLNQAVTGHSPVPGNSGLQPHVVNVAYIPSKKHKRLRPATDKPNLIPATGNTGFLPASQNACVIPTSGQQGRVSNYNLKAEGQPIIHNSKNGGPVVIMRRKVSSEGPNGMCQLAPSTNK